jgi:hypothetical protein
MERYLLHENSVCERQSEVTLTCFSALAPEVCTVGSFLEGSLARALVDLEVSPQLFYSLKSFSSLTYSRPLIPLTAIVPGHSQLFLLPSPITAPFSA